jgi:hypothetical protein
VVAAVEISAAPATLPLVRWIVAVGLAAAMEALSLEMAGLLAVDDASLFATGSGDEPGLAASLAPARRPTSRVPRVSPPPFWPPDAVWPPDADALESPPAVGRVVIGVGGANVAPALVRTAPVSGSAGADAAGVDAGGVATIAGLAWVGAGAAGRSAGVAGIAWVLAAGVSRAAGD